MSLDIGRTVRASAPGCYRLELPEGTWVDVLVAANAVDAAAVALRSGDLEMAEEGAALAESLVRLPFLAGEDGAWVEAKRRESADVRVRAGRSRLGCSWR